MAFFVLTPQSTARSLASLLVVITTFNLAAVAKATSTELQQLAAQPQSTVLQQPNPTGAPYVLGAGDRVRIDVFQLPQYSGEFDVLIDGAINLPVVGLVYVDGLSLEQATDAITAQYSRIMRRPVVTLNLLSRRSIQIGVAGEVNQPGSYTLNAEGADFPTVTQILEQAGGIRMAADLRQVQIRRSSSTGAQTFTVDLWELLRTGNLADDVPLRDGDTVFVPTAESFDLANVAELTAATFAADDTQGINIAVVGEVFRPGPYTVTGTASTGEAGETGVATNAGRLPTVTRAIQVAGGIKPLADVRRVEVRRPTRAGTEQRISVNLWQLLQAGDLNQDLILQEGDTVVVPTASAMNFEESTQLASASFSPDTIRVNVVGEVEQPGVVEVSPSAPLTQAVLAAGGFNTRARRRSVELIRLNPNGTVTARPISINFDQGLEPDQNPPLQNNDVIVVRRSTVASISDALDTVATPFGRLLTLFTVPFTLLRLFESDTRR